VWVTLSLFHAFLDLEPFGFEIVFVMVKVGFVFVDSGDHVFYASGSG
jgi:hypothetical protein